MSPDNMVLMRGEHRGSDAASELLDVVNEEAQAVLEAHGKSEGQRAIEVTGCAYADTELLPILRASGRFLDQE